MFTVSDVRGNADARYRHIAQGIRPIRMDGGAIGDIAVSYLLIKSLHVATMVAWMGGMVLLSAIHLWLSRTQCPRTDRETAVIAAVVFGLMTQNLMTADS